MRQIWSESSLKPTLTTLKTYLYMRQIEGAPDLPPANIYIYVYIYIFHLYYMYIYMYIYTYMCVYIYMYMYMYMYMYIHTYRPLLATFWPLKPTLSTLKTYLYIHTDRCWLLFIPCHSLTTLYTLKNLLYTPLKPYFIYPQNLLYIP